MACRLQRGLSPTTLATSSLLDRRVVMMAAALNSKPFLLKLLSLLSPLIVTQLSPLISTTILIFCLH